MLKSVRARVALFLAAAAVVGSTPAYAGTVSFHGTVTDSVTGQPVSGACVLLWKEEGDTSYSQDPAACTDETGQWSYSGLDAGIYYAEATADGYVRQYAYGRDYSIDAERFTVADGDDVTVDLAMEQAGSIAGTITDSQTGDPIDGACAQVVGPSNGDGGCTGFDGTYVITGLRPGSYAVSFSDFSGGHIYEYAHDAADYESATQFEVVAGQTVQVDEDLRPAARITGTVTDATTGDPLPGACVQATQEPDGFDAYGFACADETGSYVMTGVAPGTYYVAADDESGAHPRTWYPATTDSSAAVTVTTTEGAETSGVDIAMPPAAYLSGTVTRASTGEPLADVCVYGYRVDGVFLRGAVACTDASGTYTIGALPTGSVTVLFSASGDPDLLQQWAYGQETQAAATLIPVTAGQTTTGVDAALVEGGRITGRIVNAKTKQPIEGACATVGVYSHRAGENGTQWPSACTGADGRYEIRGLPTGSYTVEFYDPDGTWAWQFFPNKGDRVQAAQLSVSAGSTLSGINAKLVPGGRITGLLLDETTGQPAQNVCVDAFTGRGHLTLGTTAQTFEDGTYELRGFPSTNVKVSFFDCGGGWATEWAYDKASYETATAIRTTAGQAVTVDATVAPS